MFLTNLEKLISKKFLDDGYVVLKVNEIKKLEKIQNFIVKNIKKSSKKNINNINALNSFYKFNKSKNLNETRLKIYNKINSSLSFRKDFTSYQSMD